MPRFLCLALAAVSCLAVDLPGREPTLPPTNTTISLAPTPRPSPSPGPSPGPTPPPNGQSPAPTPRPSPSPQPAPPPSPLPTHTQVPTTTPRPSHLPSAEPTTTSPVEAANSWEYIFQTVEWYLIPFFGQLALFELYRGVSLVYESRRPTYKTRTSGRHLRRHLPPRERSRLSAGGR